MKIAHTILMLSVATLFGCGSSTTNGSSPGTGNQVLLVSVSISAENRVDNAVDANGFDTHFEVTVKRAGQDVTDARVVLKSSSGERVLSLVGNRYEGGHVGYDRFYELTVTSGGDSVSGAVIAGPTLHRLTHPVSGTTVPPGQDVTITWSRDEAADSAEVKTKRFELKSTADSGSLLVPADNFPGKVGETEQDEVQIIRQTRVGLAGGSAGSQIVAKVRNRVESFLVGAR